MTVKFETIDFIEMVWVSVFRKTPWGLCNISLHKACLQKYFFPSLRRCARSEKLFGSWNISLGLEIWNNVNGEMLRVSKTRVIGRTLAEKGKLCFSPTGSPNLAMRMASWDVLIFLISGRPSWISLRVLCHILIDRQNG